LIRRRTFLLAQARTSIVVIVVMDSGFAAAPRPESRDRKGPTYKGGVSLTVRFNWPVELHPMLVHFSIVLLCFAFFLDVAAWLGGSQSARTAALYSLIAGAVATAVSLLSGLITPEAREREGRGALEGLAQRGFSLQRFFSGRLVEVHKHWAYVLLALVVVWLIVRLAAEGRAVRWHRVATGVGVLALIALVATGYRGLWVDDVNLDWRVSDGNGNFVAPIDPRTGHAMTRPDWQRYFAEFTEQVYTAFPHNEIADNAL